jgi:D-alanyl-D-alanine carboxypeptidase
MGGGVSFLKRLLAVAFTAASAALLGAHGAGAADKFSALIIDVDTGRVMQQVNADAERIPASLTKMMTLYLAFDALEAGRLKLDQQLPVSARAQAQSPSKLGLRAGTTIPVQQAILGLVTRSANDAAVVLAEAMGGSEEAFAEMMTARAQSLGMTRTHFRNASGLPNPNQFTTARDMATLGLALMHDHPRYYPYFSTKSFVYRGQTIGNHNHLLTRYEGTDGIKTGYTAASGFNLVASVKRDGHHLIGVVFGGTSGPARDARMMALLDRSFAELNGDGIAVASAKAKAKTEIEVASNDERAARMPTRLGVAQGDEEEEAPKAAAPAPSVRGAKWGVQVGAFKKKSAALAHIRQVRLQAPVALKGAQPQVVAAGNMYRARLVGISEARARETCRALAKSRVACVPMPPKQLVASR